MTSEEKLDHARNLELKLLNAVSEAARNDFSECSRLAGEAQGIADMLYLDSDEHKRSVDMLRRDK